MRTESFNGALLSTLIIVSLMVPAIMLLSASPASAPNPDLVGKTTIGLYNICTLIIEDSAENYENIVRGKENAYAENHDAYPPQQYYVSGDRPPVMAAKRVGSGAVVVAGIGCTCRDGRWNSIYNPDKHLDILLDCAFQWMVPGAENVLWYEGYNVFNNTTACGQLVAALGGKGYSIVGDNTEPITSSLLSPYDILINPQMELGSEGTGGNPDLLPGDDVAAISGFVESGGGLLILDGGDHGGWNFCEVQNKILENLNMGIYLQSDSMIDNVNNWDHNYEMFADVDNTTAIGSAYENATAQLEDYEVAVDISPSNRRGMPGTTLIYYVKVTNTGRVDDNYDLTVVDTGNWSLDISPAELFVENGKFEWAVLEVRIPDEASLGAEDTITVTATSQTITSVKDSGACSATVPIYVSKVDNVKIFNPYKNYDNWYKGNLQSHTENSDGANTSSEMMSTYRENGFHFNSITDDDHLTNSEAFTDLPYFLGIIGTELKVDADMIAIDISTLVDENQSWTEIVDNILAQGGLPIPASISWSGGPFPLENLRQCIDAGSRLIELQGGTVEEALIAREKWDTLLTEGRLVYGLMNDDAHNIDRVGRWGWNMVNSPELTKDAILQNLEEGNSYCVQGYFLRVGIGPEIYSITVENENAISISSSGNHVLFIGDNGLVLDSQDLIGGTASPSIPLGVSYVRMEVYGDNGGVSCTQPMMVSSVKFKLVTPTKISLNANLWLENGSKLVVKFYTYGDEFENENVIETFAPPARIKFENVSHPENKLIKKVVLQVTGENTENVISTIASFTVSRGVSVDISPSYQVGVAGKTLNYEITVTNMGNVLDSYVLAATDDAGWAPTLLDNLLKNIEPGENGTVMLSVTIPEHSLPCTRDNIVIVVTSTADNAVSDTDGSVAHACGNALFMLENLYAVNLDTDLYLEEGSRLVLEFYTYAGAYQGENVVWTGSTPDNVSFSRVVPHPQGKVVEKVEFVLTNDVGNVISTIESFVVRRSDLMKRISAIKSRWPYAPPPERTALMSEISGIKGQWSFAPA